MLHQPRKLLHHVEGQVQNVSFQAGEQGGESHAEMASLLFHEYLEALELAALARFHFHGDDNYAQASL